LLGAGDEVGDAAGAGVAETAMEVDIARAGALDSLA
jgi:hypothetical protein